MIQENSIVPKPQYKVKLENVSFIVVFDVNLNETKKGIKIRFHPQDAGVDVRKLNDLSNKIALVLQKQFSQYNLQVDRDTQVQDPSIIGFIVPLISISNFIMKRVIKGT